MNIYILAMLYDGGCVVWERGIGAEYSIKNEGREPMEKRPGGGNSGWRDVWVLTGVLIKRGFVSCTMQDR